MSFNNGKPAIRPEQFPVGSLESRMAMRALIEAERNPGDRYDFSGLSDEEFDFAIGQAYLKIVRRDGCASGPNGDIIERRIFVNLRDGASIWFQLERCVLGKDHTEQCAPVLIAVRVDEVARKLIAVEC